MGKVVVQAQWISHADAGEGEAFLAGEEGDLFGLALAQREPLFALVKTGIEQAGHVFRLHRAVGDTALRGVDLDQGFEPEQAARTVAYQFDRDAAHLGFMPDRARDLLGAQ